jgi:hypothetical protein
MIRSEVENYVWSHSRWQVDSVIFKQVHNNVYRQIDTSMLEGFRVGMEQEIQRKVVTQLRLDMESLL